MSSMHLNVFIAKSGICSRRKADSFIKNGQVTVNGACILQPWHEVTANDSVEIDGQPLNPQQHAYIVFNKPKGVTTTLKDRFAEKKIADFIPKKYGRVYPVGRLDRDSRGLIILTNDGDFCFQATHPKFEIEKEYLIKINGKASTEIVKTLKKGVKEGGDKLKVKSASIDNSKDSGSSVKVVISEGKKRHLRRLFKALGFSVTDLKRVRIGSLKLSGLKAGTFKTLDGKTIRRLVLGEKA